MSSARTQHGRHMLDGTVRLFLAEALLLPTGIIVAAFLARRLSPAGYGLFTLAATTVAWIEWGITSLFSRSVVKFVGEADDWRPIGATVLRLYLATGLSATVLLWILAGPLATMFHEPGLASYLRLFSLDIPLFCLSQAQRNILVGLGGFRSQAMASASRWMSRLLLIVIFVEMGLSIAGAVLGSIGASVAELAVSRFYVRPSLLGRSNFPMRRLWGYAAPLFVFAISIRLFDKLDLFMLKALGGTAAEAGVYGAAQNLSLVPGLFALSFSPLLLSTISRMLRTGDEQSARSMSRDAMRIVLWTLPFAAMTAGAATDIVSLFFGTAFLSASKPLSLLIFSSVALVMISIATAILTAAGKPGWTFFFSGPLPCVAMAGHFLLIPRLGAVGASLVTMLVATLGGLLAVSAVYRCWRVFPPLATLRRSILVSTLAFMLAFFWQTPGGWLLLKLPLTVFVIVFSFTLFGEFSTSEIALARSMWRWRTPSEIEAPREV